MGIGLIIVFFLIAFSLTIRNLFVLIFSIERYTGSKHRSRLRQLKFKGNVGETTEDKAMSLMDKVTDPVIKYVIPSLRLSNMKDIEEMLMLSKWDRYMTAMQFVSISIITKILALIFFIIQMNDGVVFALVVSVIVAFAIDFLIRNEISERKKRLLLEFPDFIRMVQVYLSGGLTYVDSLVESVEFMGEDWQEIIRNIVAVASTGDIEGSLDVLVEEFPIRESKEFVSLVKLSMSQGGDLSEAFNSQADRVKELYIDAKDAQIEKRKIYATLMQFPLLVAAMLTFALPLVGSLMEFTGM